MQWKEIPWKNSSNWVFYIQQQIYNASKRKDIHRVHNLQRRLIESKSRKYLAVRRVTQDNYGKNTPGVDGIANLDQKERLDLAHDLRLGLHPYPVRRIFIPKPGKKEKRPLGIPTIRDRCLQALILMALEPEWERRFEPNSYGFRPGRCTQDAINAIHSSALRLPKYVLDADIKKCYDRIDHNKLLQKLNSTPEIMQQVKLWLEAGFMLENEIQPTDIGTPQGGVISPLLANIALHGMEEILNTDTKQKRDEINFKCQEWNITIPKLDHKTIPFRLVRYADDFVVLHPDLNMILYAYHRLKEFLRTVGLEFSESKTRIRHLQFSMCCPISGEMVKPGADFVGFTIRQFPIKGYHNRGKIKNRATRIRITDKKRHNRQEFKTLTFPSKKSITRQKQKLSDLILKMSKSKNWTQRQLIQKLNPVIWGWSNYFCYGKASRILQSMDHDLFEKLWIWAKRRHKGTSHKEVKQRYWHKVQYHDQGKFHIDNWLFACKNSHKSIFLAKYSEKKIRTDFVKVPGSKSPYDGDWRYWGKRWATGATLTDIKRRLMRKQDGKCTWCGQQFLWTIDTVESDHIIRKRDGGRSRNFSNLQLLHKHCHREKTSLEIKQLKEKSTFLTN